MSSKGFTIGFAFERNGVIHTLSLIDWKALSIIIVSETSYDISGVPQSLLTSFSGISSTLIYLKASLKKCSTSSSTALLGVNEFFNVGESYKWMESASSGIVDSLIGLNELPAYSFRTPQPCSWFARIWMWLNYLFVRKFLIFILGLFPWNSELWGRMSAASLLLCDSISSYYKTRGCALCLGS